jgi:hypothetical protein
MKMSLVKAKTAVYDICTKFVKDDVPRCKDRRGDNKKRSDGEDILKYFQLLDENKVSDVMFLSRNCRRVPLINPGQVDLCFLLETIEDLRHKVVALCDLKNQVQDLSSMVENFAKRQPTSAPLAAAPRQQSKQQIAPGNEARVDSYAQRASVGLTGPPPVGMRQDHGLKVVLPPLQAAPAAANSASETRQSTRRQPVVGTSSSSDQQLRASQQPREFHLYLGNLDVNTTEDGIKAYVQMKNNPVRVLSCEIVRSTRPNIQQRAVAAHVVINQLDKTKAFDPQIWPSDVTIRAWRQPKSHSNRRHRSVWDSWDE